MKIKTVFYSFAVLALCLSSASAVQANGPYSEYGRGYYEQGYRHGVYPYEHGFYGFQGQPLSEIQLEQLDPLFEQHYNTMKPLFRQLRAKERELSAYKFNSNVDNEAIHKLIAGITELEDKIDQENEAFRKTLKEKHGIEFYDRCGRTEERVRRGMYKPVF